MAVISSIVGATLGAAKLLGSRKASKQAKKDNERFLAEQKRLNDPQIKLSELQLALFQDQGIPLINEFIRKSTSPFSLDAIAQSVSLDVNRSFDKAIEAKDIALQRAGIRENDPRKLFGINTFNIAKAATEAGLRNKARRQARQDQINALGNAANVATGFGAQATNTLGRLSQQARGDAQNALKRQSDADEAFLTSAGTIIDSVSSFGQSLISPSTETGVVV